MPAGAVETVGSNGSIAVNANRGAVAPGAGTFVSKVDKDGSIWWEAARVPVTMQVSDPLNPERKMDKVMFDDHGVIKTHLCPAAVDTIFRMTEGKTDRTRMQTMAMPEPSNAAKDAVKGAEAQIAAIREIVSEQGKAQAASMKALTDTLIAVFSGRAPSVVEPPKRRGRPPKNTA